MKLSEMNAAQLAQAMCDLVPPLCRMAKDPRIAEAISRFAEDDGNEPAARYAEMIEAIVPLLLTEHEDAFFRVLGVLTGKSADTLRRQNGLAAVREMRLCWDEDLLAFFTCAGMLPQAKC